MTDENGINEIAECIETLDNLIAAMEIPMMPAEISVKALKVSLPELRDRLFDAYSAMGGENHWGMD